MHQQFLTHSPAHVESLALKVCSLWSHTL